MKVRITTPHVTSEGAVAAGTVLDLDDAVAIDYLNAKLAEPVIENTPETATSKKKKATATSK